MVFHAYVTDVKDNGQARVGVQGAAENEYAKKGGERSKGCKGGEGGEGGEGCEGCKGGDGHKGELPAASISAMIPDFFPPVRAIRGCGTTQVMEVVDFLGPSHCFERPSHIPMFFPYRPIAITQPPHARTRTSFTQNHTVGTNKSCTEQPNWCHLTVSIVPPSDAPGQTLFYVNGDLKATIETSCMDPISSFAGNPRYDRRRRPPQCPRLLRFTAMYRPQATDPPFSALALSFVPHSAAFFPARIWKTTGRWAQAYRFASFGECWIPRG